MSTEPVVWIEDVLAIAIAVSNGELTHAEAHERIDELAVRPAPTTARDRRRRS